MSKPIFTPDPPPVTEDVNLLREWLVRQLERVSDWWPLDLQTRVENLERLTPAVSGTWPIVDFSSVQFTGAFEVLQVVEPVYFLGFGVTRQAVDLALDYDGFTGVLDSTVPFSYTNIIGSQAGIVIAVGGNEVSFSTTGLSWSPPVNLGMRPATRVRFLDYIGDQFIACGSSPNHPLGADQGLRVATSPDGEFWTEIFDDPSSYTTGLQGGSDGTIIAMPYFDPAPDESRVRFSTDGGLNWANSNVFSSSNQSRAEQVKYVNGIWFAFGTRNSIWTSSDLISFTTRLSGSTSQFDAVVDLAYGDGIYVAVTTGALAKYYTSTDGLNWTDRGAFFNGLVNCLYFDPVDKWIFVSGTTMRRSTDGITWTNPGGSWSSLALVGKILRTPV